MLARRLTLNGWPAALPPCKTLSHIFTFTMPAPPVLLLPSLMAALRLWMAIDETNGTRSGLSSSINDQERDLESWLVSLRDSMMVVVVVVCWSWSRSW